MTLATGHRSSEGREPVAQAGSLLCRRLVVGEAAKGRCVREVEGQPVLITASATLSGSNAFPSFTGSLRCAATSGYRLATRRVANFAKTVQRKRLVIESVLEKPLSPALSPLVPRGARVTDGAGDRVNVTSVN